MQNIFVTRLGVCKLGDFGLMRILHTDMSYAKSAITTPQYMAPELWCGDVEYRYEADLWALGCVLYFICCLRAPVSVV